MTQANAIGLNISDADLDEIFAAANAIKAKLQPHLVALTAEDRRELPKMGEKTTAFVEKARNYAQENAELVPAFIDVQSFNTDLKAVETLSALMRILSPLAADVEDSLMLSGSEAYQAALVFYRSVKMAKELGVPNAEGIYNDLSSRFPGGSAKSTPEA